ncbi:flagellar protein FlhE [Sodalis glossinidius]|uniref:flagellar protein FlhE n=1 Tax=Sodalis glossinidius TaxID=63612 RepID=UPI0013051654|nr:flagellar protein FlhE [Sodalis glossinidius]
MAICLGGRCFFPDGLAGRSLALTGQPAGNPVTLWLKWPGHGAIVPPVRLLRYRLLINYQSAWKGVVTR